MRESGTICSRNRIFNDLSGFSNEILYQGQVNDLLLNSARVTRLEQSETGWALEGIAWGETLDLQRHEIYTEVKAATLSGLAYRCEKDRHVLQCVLDV